MVKRKIEQKICNKFFLEVTHMLFSTLTRTPAAVLKQFLDQDRVKENVNGWKNNVKDKQLH